MRQSDWASVFSSLPNTAFFEVVRHYLGPVSTPFHKPDLIAKLTAFLKRDDVIRRSLDFIDEEDAQVLSCIDLYPHPTEKTLKCVLPNIRPLALQEKLINLEERLLIIKEWKSGDSFFSLTPLGIEAWRSGILGPGVILGKPLGLIKRSIEPWYDDNFLNSALSFLLESHPLFRIEGGWRKKTLKLLKQRFPGLFHDHLGEERLLLAGRGIIETGLAEREAGRLEAALKAWRDMEGLSRDKRRIVMIAGAIQERGLSRYIAIQIARTFTECLPAGKVYALDKMTSLLQIIVGGQYPMSPKAAQRILSHLVLLGELVPGKGTGLGRPQPRQPAGDRCLDITPAGDIICHPGLPLFCDLALSAEPVSNDIVTSYRLEKNRFIGGLNTGIDTQSLVRQIEEHSGQPLPGNIATLLSEWETEFRAVSFRFAVVLQAKGRHRKLLEETGALKRRAISHPAGGVWLLDYKKRDSWSQALANVGITQIPRIQGLSQQIQAAIARELEMEEEEKFLPPPSNIRAAPARLSGESWEFPDFSPPSAVLEEYARLPAAQQLPEQERMIFTKRLQRRLILVPDQIRPGAWRYEIMTAKGLDYQSKIHLAEMAIAGKYERLELTIADGKDMKTITIIPRYLEKHGKNHVLIGISLPEEQVQRYSVRKIGYLKRIKTSLF